MNLANPSSTELTERPLEVTASLPELPPAGPPLRRVELFFVWGFWAFLAGLTFINALVNDATSSRPALPAAAPLVAALIDCLIWAMLTPLIFRLTRRFSLDRPRWIASMVLLLMLGLAISICIARIMSLVRYAQAAYYMPPEFVDAAFGEDTGMGLPVLRRVWFMNEYIVYLVVLAAGYAHDFFMRYQARHEQASQLQAQAAHLRAELSDARLSALRSQLNPHFLFNTLNAVSALIDRNPRGARRMLARLSDLLRDTLDASEVEVSLERELIFIRRYVEIMQTRFQDRLQTSEDIDPDTLHALVPNLILQPLVENAIKHGIEKSDGPGHIEIRARHIDSNLVLSVIDNGHSELKSRIGAEPDGTGIGLRNTKARLMQSYGEQQSLSLRSNPGGGVIAEIVLPFHTELKLDHPSSTTLALKEA